MEALMLASYVLKTQRNYPEIDSDRIAAAGSHRRSGRDIVRSVGAVAAIAFFVVVLNA